jgi:Tfp pilus tip-associated adhesin PilY1
MKKMRPLLISIIFVVLFAAVGAAVTPPDGEEALFTTSTSPDALIVLDLSGSMAWNPAGGSNIWGSSTCSGTFYSSSGTGHNVNCSRLAIAKRAMFNVLDDNNDGTINSSDEGSLGVRIGYMRYYDCSSDDTGGSYTSGCNQIPGSSSTSRRYIGSKYSQIYCNSSTSCTIGSTGSYAVGGESASGGTPIGSALNEAKLYLDAHKAADAAKVCRQKFVIFITDGSDTFSCSGSGAECDGGRYKGRREAVARAKVLADAGYKVFVIGFGATMPDYLENTLNWMAYHGGTDNPNAANTGSTSGFTPGTPGACTTASDAASATCYDSANPSGVTTSNFKANSNDPGYAALSGYAFLAADADQLAAAMKTAINLIREATYSFSQASVQSSRTTDENFIYEGSFQPVTDDPFWLGHLRKFQISANGSVGAEVWDAGNVLQATSASSRNMLTCKAGAMASFTTVTAADLDVASTTVRDQVVGYFRGDPAYNQENWKLGDVFRSTPITVGTPSIFFEDVRDAGNAFATHRSSNVRSSANGNRLIVAGANDGQFHAFKTSDGAEAWSFIPPSMLTKLKNIYHTTHPTALTHQYFVDGPVTVADAWLGIGDGTGKAASDWKTILVFGLGRGSVDRLWSSSSSCATGFGGTYAVGRPYFCGYYALDITNSLSPDLAGISGSRWLTISPSASQAPYLGDSWSKMMIGRVRINVGGAEREKWVGVIGGGYNAGDCTGGSCDTRGKGIYVIDLRDGTVLWSYTRADNAGMNYSIPAQPSIVDTDNDGFIDTVYIGDIGGNMWRLKFCRSSDMPSCGTANWSGGRFFASSTGKIYTGAAVAKGSIWVSWGTGDKTDPTAVSQESFFVVRDDERTNTYTISDIVDVTATGQTFDPVTSSSAGYRIQLSSAGEKILAEPTIFGGVVYFTTYTPPSGTDPCAQGGTAKLFGLNFKTGAGAMTGDVRSITVGTGIPSAPVISLKPDGSATPDLYVTTSGGGGTGGATQRVNFNPPGPINRTNMLYWRDQRIQ